MRRLRACLGAAAAVGLTAAGATALVAGNASGATTALSNRWYAAAPYLMPLDNDPPDPDFEFRAVRAGRRARG